MQKKLYPNVDFYTGIIYEAMGFPVEMFPVLFAIGRMPGWLAQWEEALLDPEQKIARPAPDLHRPGRAAVRADGRAHPHRPRPGGAAGQAHRRRLI